MIGLNKYKTFNFWCQKVLPLVYDESLSYYETLCKVVTYINSLIKDNNIIIDNIEELKNELDEINNAIKNFDTSGLEKMIEEKIATMIFVGINESGYITYYIPASWSNIEFKTTGLDVNIPGYKYGHLVLFY